ncbi:MAG: enoyl-CoA hydratase-related protein, partial [bacterium]
MILAFRDSDAAPDVYGAFSIEALPSGVVILWFDDPTRKVNLLDSKNLDSLHRALAALKLRHDSAQPRALIFASGKDGQFIAGADVEEFETLESPAEAEAKVKDAQSLFDEFTQLPYPTVAAIQGPCLGGGLELALAFDCRIASDDRGVSIGLPEVRLGILPGFGGSQRLPRLVGFTQALGLILTGRSLDSHRARKAGLVDEVLPHPRFVERVVDWTEKFLARPKRRLRRGPPAMQRLLEALPPYRAFALREARRTVLRQTGGHYPAPFEIMRVLGTTWGRKLSEGLKIERKAVAKLLFTPESMNLRRIFLLGEDAKRKPAVAAAHPLDRVAVIGAGTMGGEIAYLMSRSQLHVRLRDIKPEPVLRS